MKSTKKTRLHHIMLFMMMFIINFMIASPVFAQCTTGSGSGIILQGSNGGLYPLNLSPVGLGTVLNTTLPSGSLSGVNSVGYNPVNGKYYFMKNDGGGGTEAFWSFDPATNTYQTLASFPASASLRGGVTNDGKGYYAMAGSALYYYNIVANTWTSIGNTWVDQNGNDISSQISSQSGGDLAIDGSGNLWLLTSYGGDNYPYTVYKVLAPLPTTATSPIVAQQLATGETGTSTGSNMNGIAFTTSGEIILSNQSKVFRLNNDYSITSLGSITASFNGNDLTGCAFPVNPLNGADFGDAPNSYGTLLASGGASHLTSFYDAINHTSKLMLGSTIDIETDGQASTTANGDDTNGIDDENGITTFPALISNATTYSVTVAVKNTTGSAATVSGWIDFNLNGTFDAGELAQATIANNATTATLTWSGLTGLVAGTSYARFRIASKASEVAQPTGTAMNGEVEDYQVTISPCSVSNIANATASPSSICIGGSSTLSATCATGTVTWYSNATLTTTITSPVSPIATTTYYGACVLNSCKSPSAPVTVNVTATPVAPTGATASPSSICVGGSSTLSATCATGTLTWYSEAALTNTISSITNPSVSPTSTTTYYGACVLNTCKSPSAPVTVNVTATPVAPTGATASPSSICVGGSSTLSATCATGTLTWYSEAALTNTISSITNPSVSPTSTTTYYGACVLNTCKSPSAPVTVTVTATPVAPTGATASPSSICVGGSSTLSATCATGTLTWYSEAALTNTISSITNPSVSPTSTTTYYGACVLNTCKSPSAPVTVNVTATPVAPTGATASPSSICVGGSSTLSATCATGTLTWYSDAALTNTISSITNPSVSPTSTTTYYGACVLNTCKSPATPVTVTVTATPTAPTGATASPSSICVGGSSTLSATCATGTLTWYSDAALTTTIISPVSPIATTTYYGACVLNTCKSPSAPVTVTVTATPVAPTGATASPSSICVGGSSTLSATCATGTLTWYSDAALTTTITSPVSPIATTTYYGACVLNTCKSPSAPVTVNVTATPVAPTGATASPSSICVGGSSTLSATCASGTLTWYSDAALTTTITSPVSPIATTTYYGACVLNTCKSPSAPVTVNVTATPVAPTGATASPSSICVGGSSTLSATCATGTLTWYSEAALTNTISSITNPSVSPTSTTTYYGACVLNTCKSPSAPVTVNVTATPVAPIGATASPSSICVGGSSTLSATCASGTLTWYKENSLTTVVASPVSPTINTTYYASCVLNTCKSPANSVDVAVNSGPVLTASNFSKTNPTTCTGTNGTVKICGLVANTNYAVAYNKNGAAQTPVTQIANGTGCVTLSGLSAGTYDNFEVSNSLTTCSSGIIGGASLALSDPASPTITLGTSQNPSACGSNDGFIQLNGLTAGTSYTLNYLQNGATQTPITFTASTSPSYTITGLTAGNYTNITVTGNACVSNALMKSLSDPTTATISLGAKTDPTACSANDGTFTVSGLAPNTSYTLTYIKDGINQTPINFASGSSTSYVVSGLIKGTYTNIRVSNAGCFSNGISATLTDPTASIITLAAPNNPSACGKSDGSITLTGLTAGTTYTIKYKKNGIWQAPITYVASSSSYTITGLTAGAYSNITASNGDCVSNALTQILADPGAAVIATGAINQPTICGANDGSITITGLTAGLSYTLNYVKDGIQQTATTFTASGTSYVITGLSAGNYTGINVNQGGCISNTILGILSNPGGAIIDVIAKDTKTCTPANEGKLLITGLSQGLTYTINYKKNGVAQTPIVYTATTTSYAINGLSAGSYENITATQGACISNAVNEIISTPSALPAPVLSKTALNTVCPTGTADLSTIIASNKPTGTKLTWHTATPATDLNELADVSAVDGGTYYASFYNATTNCYGPTTPVIVTPTPCANPDGIIPATAGIVKNIPILTNDKNADGTPVTDLTKITLPVITENPTKGTATVKPDGTVDYVPNAGTTGTDTFIYMICDKVNTTVCDTAKVTVIIAPAPVANPDGIIPATAGTPTTIPVLGNDKNPDGTPVTDLTKITTPVVTTNPTKGTTTVNPDGTIKYTPNAGTTGTDTFIYTICDKVNTTVCDTAKVTVIITPAPIANPDGVIPTTAGTPTTIPVLTNDKNPDGTPVTDLTKITTPVVTTNPTKGTTSVNPDGTIKYTPNAGTTGTDTFIYTICDKVNTTVCDTAKVTVIITPAPIANPDGIIPTTAGTPTTIPVLTNDKNPDGTPVTDLTKITTPVVTTNPTKGTTSVNPDGTIKYTPNAGTTGTDTFIYMICDKVNTTVCDTAKVTVIITPAPIANPDGIIPATAGTPTTIPVLTNDKNPDGTPVTDLTKITTPVVTTNPTKGTTSVNPDGTINYTPNAGTTGTDTFIYTICDKVNTTVCDTAKVTVNITPLCAKPVLTIQNIVCNSNGTYNVTFSSDGIVTTTAGTLTAGSTTVSNIASGTNVTLISSNSCGASNSLSVSAPSCPPTTCTTPVNLSVGQPTCLGTGIYAVSFTVVNGSINIIGGTLSSGSVSSTGTITASVGTNVTVIGLPSSSTCTAQVITAISPTDCTTPSCTDTDPGITYSTKCNSNGTYVVNYVVNVQTTTVNGVAGNGSTVASNGTVSLVVAKAGCPSTRTIIVTAPNCPMLTPVANPDGIIPATAGTPTTIPVLTNDKNPDGTPVTDLTKITTPVVTTNPTKGTTSVNLDGTIKYTPNAGTTGTDTFIYTICDKVNTTVCDTAKVTVNITPAPIANPDGIIPTTAGTPTTIPVLTNDKNPDGTPVTDLTKITTPVVTTNPTKGTTSVNPDGTINYTPNAGTTGTDTFIYTICDKVNTTVCDTAKVTVNITPLCAKPVLTIQNIVCNSNGTYNVTFSSDGTVTTTAGTLTAGSTTVSNIASGTNVTLTSSNSCGASNSLSVSAPSCPPTTCTTPVNLSVGQPTCLGTGSYAVSFTVVNGSINIIGGTLSSGSVSSTGTITASVGTNVTVIGLPSSSTCTAQVITAISPTDCTTPSCTDTDPGITYSTKCNSNGTYVVNYVVNVQTTTVNGVAGNGSTVASNGTVSLVVAKAGCPSTRTIIVTAPNCPIIVPLILLPPVAIDDINQTKVSTPVTGSVTTNDSDPQALVLTVTPANLTTPHGSVVLNANGTYTYTPTTGYVGTDTFPYTVCNSAGLCTTAKAVIEIRDNTSINDTPIAQDDHSTTTPTTPVTIPVKANDSDPNNYPLGTPTIVSQPPTGQGTVSIVNGNVVYTPNGFVGTTTFVYQVCNVPPAGTPACDNATVTVDIVSPIANTTNAYDDAYTTPINTTLTTGNVKTNDVDLQGNTQTFNQTSSTTHGAVTSFNQTTGTFIYTPNTGYTGPDSFTYTACDNGIPQACSPATVYITILPASTCPLPIKVYLQGASFISSSSVSTSNALMRDNLRAAGVIPTTEPYTAMGISRFTKVNDTGGDGIGAGVLAVTGNNAIVDWVFVELRDATTKAVVATRTGLVQRDGDVVESSDGTSALTFNAPCASSYYVAIKHRNHIGAMTANTVTLGSTSLVDFTTMTNAQLYDTGLVLADGSLGTYEGSEEVTLDTGLKALWAGNSRNLDNKVKYAGVNADPSVILSQVLLYPANAVTQQYGYDFATPVYLTGDINMDAKVKYSGVGNDASIILYNVINKYPNNFTNKQYGFDFMTEQIPTP